MANVVPVDYPNLPVLTRRLAQEHNALVREDGLPPRWNAVASVIYNTAPVSAGIDTLPGSNLIDIEFAPGVEQETQFAVRLPNSYAEGSNLYPVVSWAPKNGDGGQVIWGLEYAIGVPGSAITSATAIESTSTAAGALMFTSVSLPAISGSGLPIGTMIFGRIYRKAAAAGDTYSASAIFLGVDINVQTDARGARAEFSKWAGS